MNEEIGIYDYSKLRGRIREKQFTQEELSKAVNLNPATFSLKICGKGLFRQNEIAEMCRILEIPPNEIGAYFFSC